MGWWITMGILVLLAALPLGVSARYDEDGAVVKVIAEPIRITLFPRPKKDKKPKREKQPEAPPPVETPPVKKPQKKKTAPKKESPSPAQEAEPQRKEPEKKPEPVKVPESAVLQEPPQPEEKPKKKGGSLTDFLPLVKIVLDFLGDFKRKLRVNLLELKLVLAGDDPCNLAVNYGRAWTAMGNLLPRLERFLVIKKRNLDVQCDFTASKTTVSARLDLTITLGRLLAATLVFAFRALAEFLKIMNKRKGGTENEPKSS